MIKLKAKRCGEGEGEEKNLHTFQNCKWESHDSSGICNLCCCGFYGALIYLIKYNNVWVGEREGEGNKKLYQRKVAFLNINANRFFISAIYSNTFQLNNFSLLSNIAVAATIAEKLFD
jgi:hypothetical protein